MPSRPVLIAGISAAALIGAAIGLGALTFVYARGSAYLTNDPAACAQCHVMGAHFAAWRASSHHAVAGCNDCHAPPGGLRKYWVKARNGLHHSYAFTTGDFVDPLRITADNRAVTEEQCRHCHGDLARTMGAVGGSVGAAHADAAPGVACTRCHATVGHWVRD